MSGSAQARRSGSSSTGDGTWPRCDPAGSRCDRRSPHAARPRPSRTTRRSTTAPRWPATSPRAPRSPCSPARWVRRARCSSPSWPSWPPTRPTSSAGTASGSCARRWTPSASPTSASSAAPGRYRDSGMIGTPANENPRAFWNADLDEAVAHAVAVVREVRPQVVVTYDENGGYGHPDHIQAHRVAMGAVDAAADAGLPARPRRAVGRWRRSTGAAVPRSVLQAGIDALAAAGDERVLRGRHRRRRHPLRRARRARHRRRRRPALRTAARTPPCARTPPRSPSTGRSSRCRTTSARRCSGVEYYRLVRGRARPGRRGARGLGGRPVRRPRRDVTSPRAAPRRWPSAGAGRRRRRRGGLAGRWSRCSGCRCGSAGVLVPVSVAAAVVGNLLLVGLALRLTRLARWSRCCRRSPGLVVGGRGDGPPSRGRPGPHRRRARSARSAWPSCCWACWRRRSRSAGRSAAARRPPVSRGSPAEPAPDPAGSGSGGAR